MRVQWLFVVSCYGCGFRVEARDEAAARELAEHRGWKEIAGRNYCRACRRSAELSAGVLELAEKGGGK